MKLTETSENAYTYYDLLLHKFKELVQYEPTPDEKKEHAKILIQSLDKLDQIPPRILKENWNNLIDEPTPAKNIKEIKYRINAYKNLLQLQLIQQEFDENLDKSLNLSDTDKLAVLFGGTEDSMKLKTARTYIEFIKMLSTTIAQLAPFAEIHSNAGGII